MRLNILKKQVEPPDVLKNILTINTTPLVILSN